MKNLLLILLLIITCQSCTAKKDSSPKAKSEPAGTVTSAKTENEKLIELAKNLKREEDDAGRNLISANQNVAALLDEFKVKTTKNKTVKLATMLDSKKDTILVMVKNGCVYCDALLANMAGKKYKSKILLITDQYHASYEGFVAKAKENKAIKGVEWVYDFENVMGRELQVQSTPTSIVFDKDKNLTEEKVGLVMLDDPEALKGQPFPIALKLLADNTVSWLQNR